MNHSNILCDEMDSLYGWSACTTGISGWVRCIPYISKPQLIRDKGGMLRHAPALPHATIKPREICPAVDELLHITMCYKLTITGDLSCDPITGLFLFLLSFLILLSFLSLLSLVFSHVLSMIRQFS